jgi:hypothetical protein
MIDWGFIDKFESRAEPPYVETVWHADQPVEKAWWYFLWLAEPDDEFKRGCDAGLVVAIGANPELLACLRNALSDSRTFCAEETAKEFPDED